MGEVQCGKVGTSCRRQAERYHGKSAGSQGDFMAASRTGVSRLHSVNIVNIAVLVRELTRD